MMFLCTSCSPLLTPAVVMLQDSSLQGFVKSTTLPGMANLAHFNLAQAMHSSCAVGQFFRGYDQYTRAIHMAAYEARPDLMRLLLAKKANPENPDRKGRTPVQCLLAPSFFDGDALHGQAHHATLRQRQTLQVDAVVLSVVGLQSLSCLTGTPCKGKCTT